MDPSMPYNFMYKINWVFFDEIYSNFGALPVLIIVGFGQAVDFGGFGTSKFTYRSYLPLTEALFPSLLEIFNCPLVAPP